MPGPTRWLPIAFAFVAVAVVPGCSLFRNDRDPTLVVGDSLTAFSAEEVVAASHDDHVPLVVRAVPGAASCDLVGQAEQVLRDEKLSAMVIEFAGNNVTPCVGGRTGSALIDVYDRDIRHLVELARERDVPVVLLGPPAMDLAPFTDDSRLLDERMQQIARGTPGVRYVDLGRTFSPHGFTLTLPCLDSEAERPGCRNGQIPVRAGDGVHFDVPGPDGYSSGSTRYADVLIDAARNPD